MPTSVLSALQIAATLGLVAWMINGFTPLPGRWLRWKMFCRAAFTIITLTGTTKDGRTEPVNVYDHLSPGSFILGPPSYRRSSTTSPQAAGTNGSTATAASCPPPGEQPVEVRASRVVL